MNVLCAICQDLLESSHDIFVTPCGHVFHFPCLVQWLEKSQSCPQCRQTTRKDRITRVYFTSSNADVIKEDSCTLQQKVDSLSFQVELKKKELSNCREENVTLKRQNSGLREEVKKNESIINDKNAVIRAMKEQNQYYQAKFDDYNKIKSEKIELQKKVDLYENIKVLLLGTVAEVEQLLKKSTDQATLVTYVAIMKKELEATLDKRRELRSTVKRLQHELQTSKMKRDSYNNNCAKRVEQLEEELVMCRSEKEELQRRLKESKNGNGARDVEEIINLTSEIPPSRKRETDIASDFDEILPKKIRKGLLVKTKSNSTVHQDDSDVVIVSPTVKKTKENEENSPYLPTKSKSIMALKERHGQRGSFTITSKRPAGLSNLVSSKTRLERGETFDGFGGHSRVDTFPVPKSSPNKLKRSASDLPKNKKPKLDVSKNKHIDEYYSTLI
ncbi:E3 ubiquitin-protein ligase TRAIP [Nasonia vitripennis]|uniref:RING-type domain-containing protein n=1 Tax=Nasonia vitripennis TaxID=7425 RepID=A0A7M7LIU6_NASVI|nr:E3 ubiquitin-protein ligase TRAIP [Nasonia vitripennis]